MDELSAVTRARPLVEGISAPPVDVLALAQAHGLCVKESDQLQPDEAGRTFRKGEAVYVVVNANDDPYRRRFTILHELAHHVLNLPSHHGDKIPATELERFAGRPPEEKLCDVFAASCLVPVHLIRPETERLEFSANSVFTLSGRFQASKPCVASSFVRASSRPLAYIFAEAGRVQHVVTSSALRAYGLFIQPVALPRTSAAARALARGAVTDAEDLDATDWCSSDAANAFVCREEAIHVRGWKQTMSLLTFEHISGHAAERESHDEDESLLPELTGILPWPKR